MGERWWSRRRLAGRRRPVIRSGVSTAREGSPNTNAPGTLVRVTLDGASPLANGIGTRAWVMFQDDDMLHPGPGGISAATYPAASDAAYATSGLALGVPALAGTSAVVDEAVGLGRAVLFGIDPNFRAWTQGTQRILLNALIGPDPVGFGAAPAAGSKERAAAEKAAQTAAAALPDLGAAIRIRVATADTTAAAKVLARRGAEVVRVDLGSETLLLVANRKELSAEEHPTFGPMLDDLAKAGIDVRAASIP